MRDCDFSNLYNKALSDYWAENYEKFSTLLQNYYISSAYYLYKDSAISKDEYELY
ncbi:cytotoxic necrotizing factor 1 domain protein, partial [Yersinia pestis PY-59]